MQYLLCQSNHERSGVIPVIPQAARIEPIEADNVILFDDPIRVLWPRWGSAWVREVGVFAVLDHHRTIVGELRFYDLIHYLLQLEPEVHHLWPYTHVVTRSWSERVNRFDQVPARAVMQGQGVVIHDPPADWAPGIALFAQHMTSVIWVADPEGRLFGKATLKSTLSG